MKIYNYLLENISSKGAVYLLLIDPDKIDYPQLPSLISASEKAGVDGFLIGGSLIFSINFEKIVIEIKTLTSLPVIIFPGSINQICNSADAVFFLSVVSGRNPENLIGKQVIAAPIIKEKGLEPISVGYTLIESGKLTTAQYMDGSLPIPGNKPEIASATALAAEYLGMKFIYLEAGSGAEYSVPNNLVKAVTEYCTIPVIVGGGIKTPKDARAKVENGAKIIVTGNHFENKNNHEQLKNFAEAIHFKLPVEA